MRHPKYTYTYTSTSHDPRGLIRGIVYGTLFLVHRICTDEANKAAEARTLSIGSEAEATNQMT